MEMSRYSRKSRAGPPLSYLAGVFDGEGCVGIALMVGRKRPRPNHMLSCAVSMCDEAPIQAFLKRFGGYCRGPYGRPGGRRPMFSWAVYSERAVAFLRAVLPFLLVKHRQAKFGIAFQVTKKRYKVLPDEELEKRESFRQKIIALNGCARLHRNAYRNDARLSQKVERQRKMYRRFLEVSPLGWPAWKVAREVGCSASEIRRWRRGVLPKQVSA